MDAPILIMTAHDYSNMVVFNANTGAFITTELLDLYHQQDLDFPKMAEANTIQFRGMLTVNSN